MSKIISKRQLRRNVVRNTELSIQKLSKNTENNIEPVTVDMSDYTQSFLHNSDTEAADTTKNPVCIDITPSSFHSRNTELDSARNYQNNVLFESLPYNNYNNNVALKENEDNYKLFENQYILNSENRFKHSLKLWALNNQVTHRCLNEIIALIKPNYQFLHNDARTPLKTPRNKANSIKLENCEMVYLGIKDELTAKLAHTHWEKTNALYLLVNIDGIPIYNSSSIEFWPILVHVAISGPRHHLQLQFSVA